MKDPKWKPGDSVMVSEDVRSHIGREILIPKFSPCIVIKANPSAVTVRVVATKKEQTIRNSDGRKSKIIKYSDSKLARLLYGVTDESSSD